MLWPSRIAITLVAAILATPFAHVVAEDTAVDASAPLRYRRIYAPADAIRDWPRGNIRYLPVDPSEFDRLVEAAQSTSTSAHTVPRARVETMHLKGRLVDGKEFEGQGTLHIVTDDEASTSAVPFSPCNLAMDAISWTKPDAAATLSAASDGDTMLLVSRSGSLAFDWSLRASQNAAGVAQFDLVLPRAPEHELSLDLPESMGLAASTGLVSEKASQEKHLRTWRIELGGATRTTVRVMPREALTVHGPAAFVRTATTYELSQRGIDITSQWRLDLQQDTLRQIEILMDPAVRLVSAKVGDAACEWTVREANAQERRVVIVLPEHGHGGQRTVRLSALAPLMPDEFFALPTLVPGASLAWQEGTLSLLVPATYELKHLTPELCRQSKAGQLAAPLAGRSIELQCYAPEASARVLVSRQRERPRVAIGTALIAGEIGSTARVTADFELLTGERFNLHAHLFEPWAIESVETVPSHALGD
ncbi:MAG TPA: hypothetical protein VHV77_09675, partial [Pirellulales bacterium]|nr:hypothetical protein [Pirellulales bacterium]